MVLDLNYLGPLDLVLELLDWRQDNQAGFHFSELNQFPSLLPIVFTYLQITHSGSAIGVIWYTNISEKKNPLYPKFSLKLILAKYQNLEKHGILFTHERSNFGVKIRYTQFMILPVYRIPKSPS